MSVFEFEQIPNISDQSSLFTRSNRCCFLAFFRDLQIEVWMS